MRDLLKATFNGVVDNTDLTDALFLLTILYSAGKSDFSGHDLIHESSKNRTWGPSPRSNLPNERNSPLTFMRLAQNWVPRHVLNLCQSSLRYLFLSNCCQILSPFINLKSHLLRKHLLWTSKFRTPNPPWSFHLVNLYFFFFSSLYRKNRDLK
jgi:hypothetical protein